MPQEQEPTAPEVTVLGGRAVHPPAAPRGRAALPRLLVVLAALALLTSAVVGQRREPAPERPPCPEPCLTPGALVLGAALPLTGVLAPLGAAEQRGVERALARANDDGGVDVKGERRRVELLVRDTGSVPDVAGQEALILVRGPFDPVALVGPCAPPVALVRVAESRGVPLVTGCQPVPPVGTGLPRHTWVVAPDEGSRAAAAFAALRDDPARRTGVFLSNDRSEQPWTTAGARAGFDVVATYRPLGQDWTSAAAPAAADGVDVVVAVTQPPAGIALWQALRAAGLEARGSYASEAGLGSAWHAAVGRDGDGTITDLVHPSTTAPARPVELDAAVSALSAELTEVLLDGLRRARSPERADLDVALAAVGTEVAGQQVRFLRDRTSPLPVRLGRWEGGRLVPLR